MKEKMFNSDDSEAKKRKISEIEKTKEKDPEKKESKIVRKEKKSKTDE